MGPSPDPGWSWTPWAQPLHLNSGLEVIFGCDLAVRNTATLDLEWADAGAGTSVVSFAPHPGDAAEHVFPVRPPPPDAPGCVSAGSAGRDQARDPGGSQRQEMDGRNCSGFRSDRVRGRAVSCPGPPVEPIRWTPYGSNVTSTAMGAPHTRNEPVGVVENPGTWAIA